MRDRFTVYISPDHCVISDSGVPMYAEEAVARMNELISIAESLREQVEQMRFMFNDDDGSIEKACSDFDKFVNS